MKLINGQKKANFLKTENNKVLQVTAEEIKEFPQTYMIAAFSDGVSKGIEFAEVEYQNILIDFGIFLGKNHYRYNETMMYWFNDRMTNTFTTEELLIKFSEMRKG